MTEELAIAIERVRRRYVSLLEEAAAHGAPTLWDVADQTLCWHVVLRDALEPDIDLEILPDAIVVRAGGPTVWQTLLPVPPPYATRRPRIRFRGGVLEIRLEVRHDG